MTWANRLVFSNRLTFPKITGFRSGAGLRSGAFQGTTLPAQYTCDGENVSPPLERRTVPAGVKELAQQGVPPGSAIGRRFRRFPTLVSLANPKSANHAKAFAAFAVNYTRR